MLSAEPEVEADNTYQDLDDFCGYQKSQILYNCFTVQENSDRHIVARKRIDIVLVNPALRAQ